MAFGNVNIAKNEVTGKFIKTDPPTKKYIDNYDKVFAKKLPGEWAKALEINEEINEEFNSEEKITYKEFLNLIKEK
jgi:hypothetical protein